MSDGSADTARDRMVDQQLAARGIRDAAVLEAMRTVPRERFVEAGSENAAYDDHPLPIPEGQTISQPLVVALMIEAAGIRPGDRVLDVGTGSGYAAAVLSRIAGRVHGIERHARLAEAARRRLATLGYDNVTLRIGDGAAGWPEAAPFDAIVVGAGAAAVPEALKQQLAIGGRLIIPVGAAGRQQILHRFTRRSETDFDDDPLGLVAFVPLVTEADHSASAAPLPAASAPSPSPPPRPPPRPRRRTLAGVIAADAEPLPAIDDAAFGAAFDRFADRRVVLLGEASHGTEEFYRARAAITRHLVAHHGFTIVAAEADWPDAAAIDRHVRRVPSRPGTEPPFQRFPTWMWRNTAIAALADWMRAHNDRVVNPERRAGFYGLDMYNMTAAVAAVLGYLDSVDPAAAAIARERYGCLTPWQNDPASYGRAMLSAGYRACEQAVVAQCRDLLKRGLARAGDDGDRFLDAAQNARLIAAAERYYRIMYYGGAESWNLRDTHMADTLAHLLEARGPQSRAVVWAHNSHIGDARHTDLGLMREEISIGQLCRERFGDAVALIGFGTHAGTVAAASRWDGAMEVKTVRPSHPDSYERLCHDAGGARCLLDFTRHAALRSRLREPRLERFIGVVYRPETELLSHYVEASLPQQFDAYVWFDETAALTPLGPEHRTTTGGAETWPFGL